MAIDPVRKRQIINRMSVFSILHIQQAWIAVRVEVIVFERRVLSSYILLCSFFWDCLYPGIQKGGRSFIFVDTHDSYYKVNFFPNVFFMLLCRIFIQTKYKEKNDLIIFIKIKRFHFLRTAFREHPL
jgi:hypothetical protein